MFGNNNLNLNLGSLDDLSLSGGQGLLQQSYNFGSHALENDQRGAISIEIRKVYLGKTRPQSEQHRRSYEVWTNGEVYNKMQENVARYGPSALDPLSMSNMLSEDKSFNFIHHSGRPEASVSIENGWEYSRFRFTIVVDCYRNGTFDRTEFVSGYTDHDGVTNAGLISTVAVDPGMVFVVNNITEARVRRMDATGRAAPFIQRSNAVVRNHSYSGLGTSDNLYLTRPSDVLRAVDKITMYNGIQRAAEIGESTPLQTYQDLDSMLTHHPMMASATNLLIPTFASRTIKSMFENSLNKFDPMNLDGAGAASLAAQNVADTPFGSSMFVNVMNRKTGNYLSTTAQFTYGDLLTLDISIDDRTDVFGRAYETGVISIPDGRNAANIGDATAIALHATSIAHSTLALMSLSGVCTLAYHATNMNTGNIEITIQACDGLDLDGQLHHRLEALKTRLRLECLNIVASEQSTFEVEVFADVWNDAFIQLTHNNDYAEYVIPSYASSSMAPIVTNSMDNLVGIAEAIDQVVDACKQITDPNYGSDDYTKVSVQGNGEARYGGLAGEF